MAGVVAVAAGGEEANHDDGRDGGDDRDAEEEEAVVVLFYEDDAVDEERVNGVPAVILNAEGAAAQAAEEQMGAEADDEPIPEVLAGDGGGLLNDLPSKVAAALVELKEAENEVVDRRVGGRMRMRNQFYT